MRKGKVYNIYFLELIINKRFEKMVQATQPTKNNTAQKDTTGQSDVPTLPAPEEPEEAQQVETANQPTTQTAQSTAVQAEPTPVQQPTTPVNPPQQVKQPTPSVVSQPLPVQQPSTEPQAVQEPEQKKSKWWIWVIVAAVVIGAGIGLYFWIF